MQVDQFASQSDTEVLLYAYLAWGEQCVERFNGQCLMNYDGGGDNCTDHNMKLAAARIAGYVIQGIITAAQLFPVTTAAGIAMELAEAAATRIVSKLVNKALEKVQEKITEKMNEKMGDLLGGKNPLDMFTSGAFAKGKEYINNPQLSLDNLKFSGSE